MYFHYKVKYKIHDIATLTIELKDGAREDAEVKGKMELD